MENPLKRDVMLQPLSREHHFTLLFCWKIKTGFSKGIPVDRIKVYADWFYKNHLAKHFEIEEKLVFPILGIKNIHVSRAINDHRTLSKLFADTSNIGDSLKKIQIQLEKHVRFEERTLFNEVQSVATQEQLKSIQQIDSEEKYIDNMADAFWE